MKQTNKNKRHLFLSLLLFFCAMLSLTIYASNILANNTEMQAVQTINQAKTEPVITQTEQITATTQTKQATQVAKIEQPATQTLKTSQPVTQSTQTKIPESSVVKQITTSNSTTDQAINTTPTFTFISPSEGKALQTKIEINGTVDSAKNVEFYLIEINSNTKKYIGTAIQSAKNNWGLNFDLNNTPNGTFYLIAKIENDYGIYESGKIKITINTSTTNKQSAIEAKNDNPNAPTTQTQTNYNDQTSNAWQKQYFGAELCQNKDYCGGNADPDNDGLNNNDEYRYGTNPLNPDTDGDGYLDGEEVKNGFDPLKPSQGNKTDKIIFESPKEKGEIKENTYSVTNVELIKTNNENKLKLNGKGLPNSFVTVYIYSSLPIIFTVKTDANGDWSYTMDKQLDNGEHEAYVAITDNTGKITAKSNPLPFVKTAEAVSVIEKASASTHAKSNIPPVQARTNSDLLIILAIILLSLGLVFSVFNLIIVYRAEKEKS